MTRQQWDFPVALDRARSEPLFLQISRSIVDDICRGRLKPGDALPGTRTLADVLKVNRVTVLTAYEELAAEGWICTHPARGTTVSKRLPENLDPAQTGICPFDATPVYPLPPAPVVHRSPEHLRGTLVFGASSPDPRLLDVEPLARAYRRALRKDEGRLLAYSDPEGHPRLRQAIASMLSAARGLAASAAHVFVTRGSQMALALTARSILRPGDTVVVEALGYPNAWQAFASAGAEVVPVRIDDGGLDVGALARLLDTRQVSAVYTTPHHQFPTTVTMAPARRLQLLELARRHRFAIIEDDYDHEFRYDGRPVLPLASLDRSGAVIYVGTFSRLLAPGLRLGFIAAPAAVIERLGANRESLDMQGDPAVDAAVAELLEDGEVQRHVRRVRQAYRVRRDLLISLLGDSFGGEMELTVPAGGVALWVRAANVDVDAWARAALRRGVAFQTAREFTFDRRPRPFMRLGYACLDPAELRLAVNRLETSRADVTPSRRPPA